MSATDVIEQIKALPPEEKARVAKFFLEQDDLVPLDFKAAMDDLNAGRLVDMERAISETPPGHLR